MWEQYALWGVYFSGLISCLIVGIASAMDMREAMDKARFIGLAIAASLFWPVTAPMIAGWCLWKEARP